VQDVFTIDAEDLRARSAATLPEHFGSAAV
jgi:hypothetical protein